MITLKVRGQTGRTEAFLRKNMKLDIEDLEQYGIRGVNALAEATPMDTGVTAASWDYVIRQNDNYAGIVWVNNNVVPGVAGDIVNIAAILQYGHATGNGGYVPGIDYINPALKMLFNEVSDKVWDKIAEESVDKFETFIDTFADKSVDFMYNITMITSFIPGLNKGGQVFKLVEENGIFNKVAIPSNTERAMKVLNYDISAAAKRKTEAIVKALKTPIIK